ncbi:MAG: diguanylate cyclase [Phycisphaeraceae bacterium]
MTQVPKNLSGFVPNDPGAPRMLLIEPEADDAEQIQLAIERSYDQPCVTRAASLAEALAADLDRFDLTLSATQTGDGDGSEVLEELLLLRPDMPIIMLAERYGQIEAAQAMREGAYDYLVKADGYLHALPAVIEKNLALHQVKQENARLQVQLTATLGQLRTRNDQLQGLVQELKTIAATDALTGIANRRAITQRMDQQFAHAVRHDGELGLIAIDLDGFKQLNDASGHPAGDRVLMLVARVLSANARASDVPGRIGGDEFVVLLPDTDPDEASQVAQRIQMDFNLAFADLAERLGYPGSVTLSIGIATRHKANVGTANDLLAAADRALYRAKDAGRSRVCMYGDAI